MSVAIVTRFHGPTNSRGARIIASVPERIANRDRDRQPGEPGYELHQPAHWRLTISYPYELNAPEAHASAAQALADRLEWTGRLVGGALADGYAFVFCGE